LRVPLRSERGARVKSEGARDGADAAGLEIGLGGSTVDWRCFTPNSLCKRMVCGLADTWRLASTSTLPENMLPTKHLVRRAQSGPDPGCSPRNNERGWRVVPELRRARAFDHRGRDIAPCLWSRTNTLPAPRKAALPLKQGMKLVGLDNAWDMRGSSSSKYRPLRATSPPNRARKSTFLHLFVHHMFRFDSRQCDEMEDDQIWNDGDAPDERFRGAGFSPGRLAILRDIRTSTYPCRT
jgi:hypothetical protein